MGAELARDGDFKDAIAGKPCSHREQCSQALHNPLWEPSLLAMAISRTPSRASLAPTGAVISSLAQSPVGAELARDGDFKDAIAGKPCSHRSGDLKPCSPREPRKKSTYIQFSLAPTRHYQLKCRRSHAGDFLSLIGHWPSTWVGHERIGMG
ncbi:hypothetical protein C9I50_01840 [Pseudomonas prosekii]|nr:hypothetical protein C9I50_01840 [Pseudomonas prosekii]